MGLLKSLFGGGNTEQPKSNINWIPLTELNQLDEIVEKSKDKTQAIFKHSTRCGISRGVINQFQRSVETENIDFYYLDLLNYRDISNEIAARFQVIHQSPQLLIIKNGAVVANDSHYDIMGLDLVNI